MARFAPWLSAAALAIATLANGNVADAQSDTPAAREARLTLRAIEKKYGSRPGWAEWSGRLRFKDVEYELRAGDAAEPETLAATAVQLRAGAATDFRPGLLQQLAGALEKRSQELGPIPSADWPAACQARAESFAPVTPRAVLAGRQQLYDRLEDLERRMPSLANPRDPWRQFLSWPTTRSLVSNDTRDAELLDRLEARWQGALSVWDAPEMIEASLAVQNYIRLYRGYLAHETAKQHSEAWNELGRLLEPTAASPAADTARIAALLHERERLGQASALTASVRRRFSQPNIVVQARTDWLQAQSGASINERYDVDDVFVGARTVGSGTLAAKMRLRILPSRAVGRATLQLEGTSRARTTGGSDGVSVISHGTTRLRGEKPFTLDTRGLSAAPTTASAQTSIVYDSIDSPGLRRRRSEAVRQTYARRPQAETEAAAAARRSIVARLDADGNDLIAKFNKSYAGLRNHQLETHRATPEIRVRSSGDSVRWECRLASPAMFAATTPPPRFEPAADLVVSIAASALEEQCLASLAGRQLTGEQMSKVIGDLLGDSTGGDPNGQDFRATFAAHPCDIQFAAGKLEAKFYINSFDSEDVQYPAMTVDALYNVEERAGDLALVRQGSLRVRPRVQAEGEQASLSGRQQTLRLAVQRKLNKALADTFIWSSPAPPVGSKDQSKLRIGRAQVDGGWLQIALTRETQ